MAPYDLDDPEGMQQEYTPAMIIHIVQTDSIRDVCQRKASPRDHVPWMGVHVPDGILNRSRVDDGQAR